MNKPAKVILLIVACLLAIGGVLLFITTMVSPPAELKFGTNHHEANIKAATNAYATATHSPELLDNEGYYAMLDRLDRNLSEGKITRKQYDEQLAEFLKAYVKVLSANAEHLLARSTWPEERIAAIDNRIDEVRALRAEGHSEPIVASMSENATFTEFKVVIAELRDARNFATHTAYVSVDDTRRKLNKAQTYRDHRYLGHNTDLMASIEAMPHRLEASHWGRVVAQVNSLLPRANSYLDDYSGYEKYYERVIADVDEYNRYASKLYGQHAHGQYPVNDLKSHAAMLFDKGSDVIAEHINQKQAISE